MQFYNEKLYSKKTVDAIIYQVHAYCNNELEDATRKLPVLAMEMPQVPIFILLHQVVSVVISLPFTISHY